jgi:phage baseplate assembly protein W
MGYRIQPATNTNNVDIALGIDLSFDNPGVFKSNYETKQQAKSNLKNLLLTRVGERYHQVTFGTNLLNILFQPNVIELKEDIANEISNAISFWLPYISIQDLTIITAEDDPTLLEIIRISLTYSVNGFSSDKITIISGEDGQITIT